MTERLEEMVQQLADKLREAQETREAEAQKFQEELKTARDAQHAEVTRVITAIGGMAHVPDHRDGAVRAKNILLMRKDFRKSQRVKPFTEKDFTGNKFSDQKPLDWLKRFEEELSQQRDMANVEPPLTRDEWMPCFMDKIDLATRERLETAMANKKPAAYVWATSI